MPEVEVIVSGQGSAEAIVVGPGTAYPTVAGGESATAVVLGPVSASPIVAGAASADALIVGAKGDTGPGGPQGLDGTIEGAAGINYSIQYRSGTALGGAYDFLYYTGEDKKISLKDRTLLIDGGKFIISGTKADTERIVFTDNDVHLLRVDTQNKKVTLLENTSSTEYYIGIGTSNPQEKFHLAKGNLKVNNTGYFGDLYVNGVRVLGGGGGGGGGDASSTDLLAVSGRFEERTDFLFLKTLITSGESEQGIEYGKTLSYVPKVVSNIICPNDRNVSYLFSTKDISNTGFHVHFSSKIAFTGYYLESFISSPNL
jgi:hypothetical protein